MTNPKIIPFPSGNSSQVDRPIPPCVPPESTYQLRRKEYGVILERALADVDHVAASALVGDDAAKEAIKGYSEAVFELSCKCEVLRQIVRT